MKKFSKFSTSERMAFDQAFIETRNAVEDALLLVEDRINSSGNSNEIWQLGHVRDTLESQLATINMEYDAIVRDGFGVTPPTPAQIQTINDLAQQVAALTGKAAKAQDAVNFASKALGAYNALKG